ncbi:hypothetical protein K1X76_04965 [bacterium]|nr:hypothetical protein [bacterium]
MKTISLIVLLVSGMVFSSSQAMAKATEASATSLEYSATYKQGNAPFAKDTKVHIIKDNQGYQFIPLGNGQAWNIQLSDLRGAVANEKGVWIYWFDPSQNTLNAFFETKDRQTMLADEMSVSIKDFQTKKAPMTQDEIDSYKNRYETYKEEALKQSR